ncbi:L,D-transpeptidase family protein [Dichotomicrobium thermohalophilum]|uniref:Murein L,D-transpeptidase YcbB/YkuD n=1 Tax=Dichotomicrobium thermohalophilum TaxID=933063 RepID=A0A397Q277_9HYPH|nr:L,D-transpeptidase family protein [Dichotomicrobium thermohalophilum]RIA55476.1 murein L,D-transpeptidase YcbB/YkuD [Dichotomicrobium thermohalophilum]
MLRGLFSALAVAAVAFGAMPAQAVEPGAPKELISRMDAVAFKLQARLSERFKDISQAEKRERGGMAEFYAESGYEFLWVNEQGLNDRARAVADVVARAETFDLNPENYPLPEADGFAAAEGREAQWLANAEYRISRSVLAYARHAQSGHLDPRSISRNLDITPDAPDPLKVLRGLAASADVAAYLEGFHPSHPQFVGLLERLRELRTVAQREPVRIPDGDLIEPGDSHPHVPLVRKRLDVPNTVAPETYDETLVAAIRRFQRKNGLHIDGLIGPATRRALNRSPADKIDTIRVNLERWRWFPNNLGERYVRVNVPEFKVRLVENGDTVFEERIVVGKPRHATPSFSDEMELVVFNPYWNVPYSITKNEILPIAQRNPSYLTRQNFQVLWRGRRRVDPYEVDWDRVDASKVRLRQSPGRGNALGEIKFLFPNKHSVYLHDTPSKHLFNRSRRAYSHGCMRVRNPRDFAAAIMRTEGWSKQSISRAIERGNNRAIRLEQKLPVHVTYFTAAVAEDGGVRFFADIYKYDDRILEALEAS